MPRRVSIALICEDYAQESLLDPLIKRIVREHDCLPSVSLLSGRGGAPKVKIATEILPNRMCSDNWPRPDLIVIGHDSNCNGHTQTINTVKDWLTPELAEMTVFACPDPHIERWYIAEQDTFTKVIGCQRLHVPVDKCDRHYYKKLLRDAVRDAGKITTNDGIEFGPDIARDVDLYKLDRLDPSFSDFHDQLKSQLKRLGRTN